MDLCNTIITLSILWHITTFLSLLKQDEKLITEADNILHMHIAASAYYIIQ